MAKGGSIGAFVDVHTIDTIANEARWTLALERARKIYAVGRRIAVMEATCALVNLRACRRAAVIAAWAAAAAA